MFILTRRTSLHQKLAAMLVVTSSLAESTKDGDPIELNGAFHIICAILKLVAASLAEAKLGALFLNMQETKALQLILAELGQHNNCWNCQQHNQMAKIMSNGDEILLVVRW
jgi:hypothetical protein